MSSRIEFIFLLSSKEWHYPFFFSFTSLIQLFLTSYIPWQGLSFSRLYPPRHGPITAYPDFRHTQLWYHLQPPLTRLNILQLYHSHCHCDPSKNSEDSLVSTDPSPDSLAWIPIHFPRLLATNSLFHPNWFPSTFKFTTTITSLLYLHGLCGRLCFPEGPQQYLPSHMLFLQCEVNESKVGSMFPLLESGCTCEYDQSSNR